MKYSIVYHGSDLDGHLSGSLVAIHLLSFNSVGWEDIHMIPGDYNSDLKVDDICDKETEVYIVDFSFDKELFDEILDTAKNVVWLDHHVSTYKALYEADERYEKLDGVRSGKHAACYLTQEYLFDEVSEMTKLASEYDNWDGEGTDRWERVIIPVHYAMESFETKPLTLQNVLWMNRMFVSPKNELEVIKDLAKLGNNILRYQKKMYRLTMKGSKVIKWEGHDTIAVNSSDKGSMLFGDLINDYDVAMVFKYDGKKDNWVVGVYSAKGVDVSLLARKYGGGGHAGAAGFQIDDISKIIN